MWHVQIIEGYAPDLTAALDELAQRGFTVRFVLPNGVNRWTVISEQVS